MNWVKCQVHVKDKCKNLYPEYSMSPCSILSVCECDGKTLKRSLTFDSDSYCMFDISNLVGGSAEVFTRILKRGLRDLYHLVKVLHLHVRHWQFLSVFGPCDVRSWTNMVKNKIKHTRMVTTGQYDQLRDTTFIWCYILNYIFLNSIVLIECSIGVSSRAHLGRMC